MQTTKTKYDKLGKMTRLGDDAYQGQKNKMENWIQLTIEESNVRDTTRVVVGQYVVVFMCDGVLIVGKGLAYELGTFRASKTSCESDGCSRPVHFRDDEHVRIGILQT